MEELTIRRNRGTTGPVRYRETGKAEKQSGSGQTQRTGRTASATVSETLRQLMTRGAQAESHIRESRRTLQAGEAVLAEVQEKLARIAELAQESAGGGEPDRAALQTEVDRLLEEIDRVMRGAVVDDVPLFLDGDAVIGEGMEALLYAGAADREGEQTLPDWLMRGIAQTGIDSEQLLRGLGLDKTASGEQLLAAIRSSSLGSSSSAGYLAALYLGAVIAGGDPSEGIDVNAALEGLQRLLEKVAGGDAPDEALAELTEGAFSSFQEFELQFTGGTAPGLEGFLVQLLLSDGISPLLMDASLLNLLAGVEGGSLELLLGLLTASQSAGAGQEAAGEAGQGWTDGTDRPDAASEQPMAVLEAGNAQAAGRDLSGVSVDSAAGELTVSGQADVVVRGTGQGGQQMIRIAGSGTVTLEDVTASVLTIDSAKARLGSAGESLLGELHLREGADLTVSGHGLLRMGAVRSDGDGILRLAGGALAVTEKSGGTLGVLTVPVVLEGAAFLSARAENVQSASGRRLEPFDIVWRTLLPGWSGITALGVDGRAAKMSLLSQEFPLRLWLEKGELTHGYPVHAVMIQGEDEFGRPRTRYAYLRWSQQAGAFQEVSMYPNPFTVTGGEPDRDWAYEELSHTLRILTPQVTAISGGIGTSANHKPFSGRVALADGMGEMALTLDGVVCQVSSGRAFSLGRGNRVTLLLPCGTENLFKSGAGCAGISLGNGASLRIDRAGSQAGSAPVGTLTAVGGSGGAGIGRDSGKGQDRASQITICGGVVTAAGTGGGAGIGAGKHSAMGPITITGGQIEATGGAGGGAGIGGALCGPVGDIRIRGGTVTATAADQAAAIGAGIQGESGDILITGTARIAKALGGNPGADIGACLFGGCGEVLISGGADIGSAMPWTRTGIALQMGEDTETLPQFRLSARALQLNRLCVLTRERAQASQMTLDADCRWIAQIQAAYQALSHQLEQNFSDLHCGDGVQSEGPLRDTHTASTLLDGMRESILLQSSQALRTHSGRGREDVRELLR